MANRIFGNGINQPDLVDLLALIRTNIIGIQTKLDSDATVSDTDYHTAAGTTPAAVPSGIQTTGPKCIRSQGDVVSMLDDLVTKWNATLTKLDADGGVTGTNFNSLWAVTDVIGSSFRDGIFDAGVYQSCLVNVLNSLVTSIAGVNAKLDLDGGVADTNYAALWNVTDTVIETGTSARVRLSSWVIGLLALAALFGPRPAYAQATADGYVVKSTITYNQSPAIDVGNFQRFSMQAAYATASFATSNFHDGAKSTNRLVVTSTDLVGQTLRINGVTLTFGGSNGSVTIATAATTALTALNISSVIFNSSQFTGVITSTHANGIVYATATAVGANMYVVAASTDKLIWNSATFQGGADPKVSLTGDTITMSTHGFVTGLGVRLSSVTATSIFSGLVVGTTYYVIKVDDNSFKLATSTTNAVAGTAIDLAGTLAGGNSWSIAPWDFTVAVNNGFAWQASNDNLTWTALPTTTYSSVTYSTAGNSIWDFQYYNYRYIRPAIVAPTTGAIRLDIGLRGKLDPQ